MNPVADVLPRMTDLHSAAQLIKMAALFDADYYRSSGSIRIQDDNPLLHFLQSGWREGRNPHPLFDVSFYLRYHPDVAAASINPLLHFITVGGSEMRRPHVLFDVEFYAQEVPEVLETDVNPLIHYLRCGAANGKDPHPLFDTSYYIAHHPNIDPRTTNPLIHYLLHGAAEGRDPHPLFDTSYYLANNPQIDPKEINPLVHFLDLGSTENMDPHPLFDVSHYLDYNPDVFALSMNPLLHFLKSGASEERDPHPLVDLSYICERTPSLRDSEINPLVHYLSSSLAPSLDPHPLFDTARMLAEDNSTFGQGENPLVHFLEDAKDNNYGLRPWMGLFDFLACFVGLKQGRYNPEQLLNALNNGCGERDIVLPVLGEIDGLFNKFLFRGPGPSESIFHLAHFYNKCSTDVNRHRAIEAGSIGSYLGIRPFRTNLDTVNQCNLRCKMCYFNHQSFSRKKRREMSLGEFRNLADAIFPYSSQVFLSFGYEPLCHSAFDRILRITSEYEVPFVTMTTNALLFNTRLIESMIDARMNRLYISTDAGTADTYKRIRTGGSFQRLIENVKRINRAKSRAGSLYPRLSFNFVMMRSNIEELPALIRLAQDLEIEEVEAIHVVLYSTAGIEVQQESLWFHKDLSNRILEEARETAEGCGVGFRFPERFFDTGDSCGTGEQASEGRLNDEQERSVHSSLSTLPFQHVEDVQTCCYWPWHFVGIGPHGDVNPCGWWHQAEPMGNVFEEPFGSIWNNHGYRTLRNDLMKGILRPVCEMCPTNGSGDMNSSQAFKVR